MIKTMKKTYRKYLVDAMVILCMGSILYYGASWQLFRPHTDAAEYECYAVAFWQGVSALKSLPEPQCAFILHPGAGVLSNADIAQGMRQQHLPDFLIHLVESQATTGRFHALPHEYPFLTLIPFTLALVVPLYWYQLAFAIWMIVIGALIYIILLRVRSRRAAITFALYLVSGSWATAAGRFDLVPSALTLLAVICAVRARWNRAFILLALATLLKFYPLVLIFPFLLAQQMVSHEKWYAWRRWEPLAWFTAVCVGVMSVSLLLSIEGTLGPFSYFATRPIQAESFLASLLWLSNFVSHHQVDYVFTYGSLNVITSLSSMMSFLGIVLLGSGLGFTYWLQWRGKIDLAISSLLTLLIVMLTGKVFSPQYLIWIAPLLAYIGEANLWWILAYCSLGLLTTWIYPYIYNMGNGILTTPFVPVFYPATTARNFLLLSIILALLISCSRGYPSLASNSEAEVSEHSEMASTTGRKR